MPEKTEGRWLLLIHQIPPKPNYFRVKVWRRLQRLGAVAIKNSVYVLPFSDQTQEDFQWVLREIFAEGGEASICEAHFVEGLSDEQVEAMFHAARDADYAQIAEEAQQLAGELPSAARLDRDQRNRFDAEVAKLRRRFSDVAGIDFFGAPGSDTTDALLAGLEARLKDKASTGTAAERSPGHAERLLGRVWVTRRGIHVDRIASAWLIRRFIDREARFKFVANKGYRPETGELRFDMFDAEFTHEGDCCTFEVLLRRFGLEDLALRPIAEIVHDIDLKDSKFERQEALGLDRLIAGIAMAHKEDEVRMARGSAVLEDLYEYFRRRPR
ncbi:MAG TPA: chromate resistance protein ChrB domain-containing protein [Candidatus Polarisedimenticolia bacterium]